MAARLWSVRAPRCSKSKCFGVCVIVLWCAMLSAAHALPPPPLPHFNLQLTTTRGCLETGDHPVYAVGEKITVTFRIGSSTTQHATATLFDILPNGSVGVIALGQIATDQTRAFSARIAPPVGVEQLQLKAAAPGVQTTRRSCSFVVVGHPTPTVTNAPPAPATPTPTASPPAAVTPMATPGAALSAEIRTDRGCVETGDHPVFVIGESIVVSFRINSPSLPHAKTSLLDILPNGFSNSFGFGLVRTNATFQFRGRIAPPTGVESLQLRVHGFDFQTAVDTCSFLVVKAATATATHAPTPTMPPMPAATETATPVATSTPTPP